MNPDPHSPTGRTPSGPDPHYCSVTPPGNWSTVRREHCGRIGGPVLIEPGQKCPECGALTHGHRSSTLTAKDMMAAYTLAMAETLPRVEREAVAARVDAILDGVRKTRLPSHGQYGEPWTVKVLPPGPPPPGEGEVSHVIGCDCEECIEFQTWEVAKINDSKGEWVTTIEGPPGSRAIEYGDRVRACVNACAGLADPESDVDRLVKVAQAGIKLRGVMSYQHDPLIALGYLQDFDKAVT